MDATLLIGGYTGDSGAGLGIEAAVATPDAGITGLGTAAAVGSPSYLARHPLLPVVYAACEDAAEVRAFAIEGGAGTAEALTPDAAVALSPLGGPWPAGALVCHVAVDPGGRWLVSSSYGDGIVCLFTLDERGGIAARFEGAPAVDLAAAASGSAPRPSRAHAALALPDGRIATTDLGHDLLRVWSVVPNGGAEGAERFELRLDQELALPAGSGPRLLDLHPSGHIYIITEYSIEIAVVAPVAGSSTYALSGMFPILPAGEAPVDGDCGAHISIDAAAARVHATVRRRNTLHSFGISADGSTLHPLAEIGTGGNWPRHHLQHDGRLHVANQLSNAVSTFAIGEDGLPGALLGEFATGAPSCVIAL
ncbi:6-phosphogluconolactonase (cycloisomerase 2 family) [Microterricola gilva]|uniref:6-phosphogluconolactonase (Cycloisomerase 2 family) n=1 Tax=Microterricola gilva TaxID=393267 RepID=A0A4Q8AIS1_9MICO|nr:beta-propeller fold lactonase family protein [Microterricola gilva]RZU63841.1 6-phosphogluconolactonase (cycloisomerase 2 family) [Microterricola gilva]